MPPQEKPSTDIVFKHPNLEYLSEAISSLETEFLIYGSSVEYPIACPNLRQYFYREN